VDSKVKRSGFSLYAIMNSKADLKAAREAIGKKEFGEAVKACKRVLLWEGENYNA
jgi:superkiller protein 3